MTISNRTKLEIAVGSAIATVALIVGSNYISPSSTQKYVLTALAASTAGFTASKVLSAIGDKTGTLEREIVALKLGTTALEKRLDKEYEDAKGLLNHIEQLQTAVALHDFENSESQSKYSELLDKANQWKIAANQCSEIAKKLKSELDELQANFNKNLQTALKKRGHEISVKNSAMYLEKRKSEIADLSAEYQAELQRINSGYATELEGLKTLLSQKERLLSEFAVEIRTWDEDIMPGTRTAFSESATQLQMQLQLMSQQLETFRKPRMFPGSRNDSHAGNAIIKFFYEARGIVLDRSEREFSDSSCILWFEPRWSSEQSFDAGVIDELNQYARQLQGILGCTNEPKFELDSVNFRVKVEIVWYQAKALASAATASIARIESPGMPASLREVPTGLESYEGFEFDRPIDPDIIELLLGNIKHTLIAAPTRSGKSTLLLAYIWGLFNTLGNGNFELVILDPKTSKWLGLETMRKNPVVTYTSNEDSARTLGIVDAVYREMNRRIKLVQNARVKGELEPEFKPLYFLFDEYSDTYGFMEKNDRASSKMLCKKVGSIMSKGAGLKIFLTIVGQTHLAGELGFSAVSRDNFSVFCLGSSKGGYSAIEKVISDQNVITPNQRKAVNDKWSLLNQNEADYRYFTNIGDQPRVGITPDLKEVETRSLKGITSADSKKAVVSDSEQAESIAVKGVDETDSKNNSGLDRFSALNQQSVTYLNTVSELELKTLWDSWLEKSSQGMSQTAFIRDVMKISKHPKGKGILQGLEIMFGSEQ